jgi:nucleoside-diphosphate-sugar epimerase
VKVLVTGGSEFVMTNLVDKLLNAGYQSAIFDKNISSRYLNLVILGDI